MNRSQITWQRMLNAASGNVQRLMSIYLRFTSVHYIRVPGYGVPFVPPLLKLSQRGFPSPMWLWAKGPCSSCCSHPKAMTKLVSPVLGCECTTKPWLGCLLPWPIPACHPSPTVVGSCWFCGCKNNLACLTAVESWRNMWKLPILELIAVIGCDKINVIRLSRI